jgi:hypothetical protein
MSESRDIKVRGRKHLDEIFQLFDSIRLEMESRSDEGSMLAEVLSVHGTPAQAAHGRTSRRIW